MNQQKLAKIMYEIGVLVSRADARVIHLRDSYGAFQDLCSLRNYFRQLSSEEREAVKSLNLLEMTASILYVRDSIYREAKDGKVKNKGMTGWYTVSEQSMKRPLDELIDLFRKEPNSAEIQQLTKLDRLVSLHYSILDDNKLPRIKMAPEGVSYDYGLGGYEFASAIQTLAGSPYLDKNGKKRVFALFSLWAKDGLSKEELGDIQLYIIGAKEKLKSSSN